MVLRRLATNMAIQDWLVSGYFGVLFAALALGSGPLRSQCLTRVGITAGVWTLGLVLTRGGLLHPQSVARALAYRIALFASTFATYFELRDILPTVSTRVLDAELHALDLGVFGFEPAVLLDRFVEPTTTEWFAFFYFSYFFVLAAHILPMLFRARTSAHLVEFSFGVLLVLCLGNILYMVVPGYGPYHALAGSFTHPLEGGPFWKMVLTTVHAGGAQKDIFPSLHTAFPVYFAWYSFRHRRLWPFRVTWPIVTFVASQIVIATLFLRWHWLIDVIAGLALATLATYAGRLVAQRETTRWMRGLDPVYDALRTERGAHDDTPSGIHARVRG